jgi:hypothetical protein
VGRHSLNPDPYQEDPMATPDTSKVVDSKVWAATGASAAVSAVLTVLNALQEHPELIGGLPVWAQSLLLLLVPTLVTFVSGYWKTSNRA